MEEQGERAATLARLAEQLRDPSDDVRHRTLETLGQLRGMEVVRTIDACLRDSSPAVRKHALATQRHVLDEMALFGSGALLCLEIPPRLRTTEEEQRAATLLWSTWLAGGMLAVTALIVREHTGMTAIPLLSTFVLSLGVVLISLRLRKDPPSPGWVFIDEEGRELRVESFEPGGALKRETHPFSKVKTLLWESVMPPAEEGETPDPLFELFIVFHDEGRLLLARRPTQQALLEVAERVRQHLRLAPSSQSS